MSGIGQPFGDRWVQDLYFKTKRELMTEIVELRSRIGETGKPFRVKPGARGAILNDAFDEVPFLVASMDRNFTFLLVNRRYALADGRTPEYYPGKNYFDLYPDEENLSLFKQVVETGVPHAVYDSPFFSEISPGLGVTYWDWSLTPIKNDSGSVAGVLLTLVEVTNRRRLAFLERSAGAEQRGKGDAHGRLPFMRRNESAVPQMHHERALDLALKRGELLVYYQPQVKIGDRQIAAVEALARCAHPERNVLDPKRFVPLAEESESIAAIDEWVLRAACRQNKAWQDAGFPFFCISVAISARRFYQSGLVETTAHIAAECGLDPQWIELEISESTAMRELDTACAVMKRLSAGGIRLSIGDFGTGFVSLKRLRKLPIHKIKIARSLIKGIPADPDDRAVAGAVIAMARAMNIEVTATGVETEDQLDFLEACGCHVIQGYLFSEALPEKEFEALIELYR